MPLTISFDDRELQRNLEKLKGLADKWLKEATGEMADTLLLLSRAEVPHDTGQLQNSGHTFFEGDEAAVAYNKVYAAYQHEGGDGRRVIVNYQKGRKGKYLQDPLQNNISKWNNIAKETISSKLSGSI